MTTARELLEDATHRDVEACAMPGRCPTAAAIAATPSGAELLRRADEPRVAEGLNGRLIHRLWRDGMLAQGRHVAPERMTWETLAPEDHALDHAIAQGILANLPAPRPPEPVTHEGEGWTMRHAITVTCRHCQPEPDRTAALVEALVGMTDAARDVLYVFDSDLRSMSLDALATATEAAHATLLAATPEPARVAEGLDDAYREGLTAAIALVQQSLDTARSEDDGENRAVRMSIAAREHIIRLLTGYRDNVKPNLPAPRPPEPDRTAAHDHKGGSRCTADRCVRRDFYRDLRRMDMTKPAMSPAVIESAIEAVWLDGWTIGVRGAEG